MLKIPEEDLQISFPGRRPPGGQGVNLPDASITVMHKPTGITVAMSTERSQRKNKEKAILYLEMILELEGCFNPREN